MTLSDSRRLLDAALDLAEVDRLHDLPPLAARLAYELIPVNRAGWVTLDGENGSVHGAHFPHDVSHLLRLLPMHPRDVPLAAPILDRRSADIVALSDVWSQREWRARPIYLELYKQQGVEFQMIAPLSFDTTDGSQSNARLEGLSLVRSTVDFSDRERAVLTELARHVRAAARRLRSSRFGVSNGIAKQYGLTPRQLEALLAISDGSTMHVASARIGITPKTLENHLQSVYSRLSVNSRTAALARLTEMPAPRDYAVGEIPY